MYRRGLILLLAGSVPGAPGAARQATAPVPTWDVVETTIADVHRAMAAGDLTAVELVQAYLDRIARYDKTGPAINAIITLNPDALARAARLDSAYRVSGFVGPLHGIPVIVKDNYDTADLPTTAGSLSLAGSIPPDDAFQVRRIREAGAIVLAKSNMAEFAFSPYHTVGSMLPGHTRNPYALNRVPAGSSGGTAAAVAANLGVIGLGTDTGNSIRGPASHTALVGIRSTIGLTSRDGIVPLYFDRDVGGPLARTVEDAVRMLDVIAGTDPADPYTAEADRRRAPRYLDYLDAGALRGVRLGVLRQWSNRPNADPEVLRRFEEAVRDLTRAGAIVVDSVLIGEWDDLRRSPRGCLRFRYDLERYLATRGPDAPVHTLDDIIRSRRFHPSIGPALEQFAKATGAPADDPRCAATDSTRARLRAAVLRRFDEQHLDALIFPTWSNPPRLIGDLNSPHGDNSQDLSPHTGFPALTVPMGYVRGSLPVGLQILGRAWDEGTLIGIAYAYEQATRHRRPPPTTP